MNTFSIILLLAYTTSVLGGQLHYVFTPISLYDKKYTMIFERKLNLSVPKKSTGQKIFNLCVSLLHAPIFELSSEPVTDENANLTFNPLEPNSLALLTRNYSLDKPTLRHIKMGDEQVTIFSHFCVSHHPHISWIVSYVQAEHSGIILEKNNSETRKFALVDYSMRLQSVRRKDPKNYFIQSLARGGPTDEEDLCGLHQPSQFRLCSICADGYFRSKLEHRKHQLAYESGNFTFMDPRGNYLYTDSFGGCENLTVAVVDSSSRTFYDTRALRCHVSTRTFEYDMYFKRNLNTNGDKSSVFVFTRLKDKITFELKGEIMVKQLDQILEINAQLRNDFSQS